MAYDKEGFDVHATMRGCNPYRPGTPDAEAWESPRRSQPVAPEAVVNQATLTPEILEATTATEDTLANLWPIMEDPTAQADLEAARTVLEGSLSHRANPAKGAELAHRLRSWRIFGRALNHCPHGNSSGAAVDWRKAHGLDRWGVDTGRAAMWLADNWAGVKLYRWNSANPTEIKQAWQRGALPGFMPTEANEPQSISAQPMTIVERIASLRAELVTLEAAQEQALKTADAVVEAAQKALNNAMAERAALSV